MLQLVIIAVSFILAWQINRLSDYLPRFASSGRPEQLSSSDRLPVSLQFVRYPTDIRKRLSHARPLMHLMVEILCPLITLILWFQIPSEQFLLQAGIFYFFVLIAVIDLKYRLILNVMIYPAFVVTLVVHIVTGQTLTPYLIGMGFAFVIFYGTFLVTPRGIGSGDIKLALLTGLIFGFPMILWIFIIGAGVGAIVAIGLLMLSRLSQASFTAMPYAPFITLGVTITLVIKPLLIG